MNYTYLKYELSHICKIKLTVSYKNELYHIEWNVYYVEMNCIIYHIWQWILSYGYDLKWIVSYVNWIELNHTEINCHIEMNYVIWNELYHMEMNCILWKWIVSHGN